MAQTIKAGERINIELTDRQAAVVLAFLQPARRCDNETINETAWSIIEQINETYGVDRINQLMDEVGL